MTYQHTQKLPENIVTVATVGGIALGLTPPGWILRLCMLGILGTAGAMMQSLTVDIDSTQINLSFGQNIIKKTFSLRDIASAKAIRTTPLQGWGIHWLGNGWLYNIYGLDAVEILFTNGKRVYIGTDEPEDLTAAINQRLELYGRS